MNTATTMIVTIMMIRWFNVDCSQAEGFYFLNDEIAAERDANSPDAGWIIIIISVIIIIIIIITIIIIS